MDYLSLRMQNQIIANNKTEEELFLHCNFYQKKVTVTVRRMAKKKRSDTITMQIASFSTFAKDTNKNYRRILSNSVQIGGHSWRILAMRYLPLIKALKHETINEHTPGSTRFCYLKNISFFDYSDF